MALTGATIVLFLDERSLMIDTDLVEQLLGVPPGYERWRVAAIAQRAKVTATWLSSLVLAGVPLSADARAYLERAQRRVSTLHAVGAEAAARLPVTVIKGAEIARRLPAGLLRSSGDADLVAPDEATLWECVRYLQTSRGAVPQSISLLRTPASYDLVVALKWPAEEPFLDKPLGADISTCAFSGDFKGVGVRRRGPSDRDLYSLFAVAEERFQRKVSVKDMLDFVVLADVLHERFGDGLSSAVLPVAQQLNLAPELLGLIGKTGDRVPISEAWLSLVPELELLAAAERSERRSGDRQLAELWFGYPLDDVPSGQPVATVHPFEGGELLSTPVGTCLLVATPTIDAELLDAAEAAASALHR